jgi:hypothetical protein
VSRLLPTIEPALKRRYATLGGLGPWFPGVETPGYLHQAATRPNAGMDQSFWVQSVSLHSSDALAPGVF